MRSGAEVSQPTPLQRPRTGKGGLERAKAARKGALVLAVGVLIAAVGILLFVFAPNIADRESRAAAEAAGGASEPSIRDFEAPPEETERDIAFAFDADASGLGFRLASSRYQPYDDAWSYEASGAFFPAEEEVAELSLRVLLLDDAGKPLASRLVKPQDEYMAKARPGDMIPFSILIYEEGAKPPIAGVKAEIHLKKAAAAPASYPKGASFPVAPDLPPGPSLAAEFRSERFTDMGKDAYHELAFSLRNEGPFAIEVLKLRLDRWKGDRLVSSDSFYAMTSDGPGLLPGERLALDRIGLVTGGKRGLDRWTLSVEEYE